MNIGQIAELEPPAATLHRLRAEIGTFGLRARISSGKGWLVYVGLAVPVGIVLAAGLAGRLPGPMDDFMRLAVAVAIVATPLLVGLLAVLWSFDPMGVSLAADNYALHIGGKSIPWDQVVEIAVPPGKRKLRLTTNYTQHIWVVRGAATNEDVRWLAQSLRRIREARIGPERPSLERRHDSVEGRARPHGGGRQRVIG
jgi:hypothetical protein